MRRDARCESPLRENLVSLLKSSLTLFSLNRRHRNTMRSYFHVGASVLLTYLMSHVYVVFFTNVLLVLLNIIISITLFHRIVSLRYAVQRMLQCMLCCRQAAAQMKLVMSALP